jgi:predicted nucleic acid-binding protein
MPVIISDASPLIALCNINQLRLLKSLWGEILIPEAVYREPRLFASSANLGIIGTVGIIKLAWLKGLIENPLSELKTLRLKGFWIDDGLITSIENEVTNKLL